MIERTADFVEYLLNRFGESLKMIEREISRFDLEKSVSCAQAFRWEKIDNWWTGIASGKVLRAQQNEDTLLLDCSVDDLAFWEHYFALDDDYTELEKILLADHKTAACIPYSSGIRIFRQEPFETLISFIISANNHFARICGLVKRLSEKYGKKLEEDSFAFPTSEALASASIEELKLLGTGYRASYILESSRKIAEGFDLDALKKLSFEEAHAALIGFPGIGTKVANCVMLFGLGFSEGFPIDVWIKRVLESLYPGEKPILAAQKFQKKFGYWSGVAQQYLFHYARMNNLK